MRDVNKKDDYISVPHVCTFGRALILFQSRYQVNYMYMQWYINVTLNIVHEIYAIILRF